jgi:pyruvate/2-oxoglutarate/acetoin dehydrogenase E1 component
VTEQCFWALDAPVRRLAAAEVPVPYSQHLEHAAIPQVDDIVEAVGEMLGGP